ncbi:MAG: hypothetical protein ABI333_21845 [bacterium]
MIALGLVIHQTDRVARLERELAKRPRPAVVTKKSGGDGDDVRRLNQRLKSLEGAVRRLVSFALTSGTKASGKSDPVLLKWIKNELRNLRDDVDSVLTGDALSTEEGKERLKKLLREARKEDRQSRRQQWQKVAAHMLQERLSRLAKDHNLDQDTTAKIGTLISDEREKMRPLWEEFRSGKKDVATALSEARSARDATDKQVRAMVNDDQYKAYEDMRRNSRIGRFLRRY